MAGIERFGATLADFTGLGSGALAAGEGVNAGVAVGGASAEGGWAGTTAAAVAVSASAAPPRCGLLFPSPTTSPTDAATSAIAAVIAKPRHREPAGGFRIRVLSPSEELGATRAAPPSPSILRTRRRPRRASRARYRGARSRG